MAVKLQ
jgi:hypothetical protein